MEFILIAIIIAWLTDKEGDAAERRAKIKAEHKRREARNKARRKKNASKARMLKLERRIRKLTTGYATPKHKREAARLHREFRRRQREYKESEKLEKDNQ